MERAKAARPGDWNFFDGFANTSEDELINIIMMALVFFMILLLHTVLYTPSLLISIVGNLEAEPKRKLPLTKRSNTAAIFRNNIAQFIMHIQ